MSKAIVITTKLLAIYFIFIATSWHLINKFTKETIVIASTSSSLGMPALIGVSLLGILFVVFVFKQVSNTINDNPFGYGSILFFGTLISTLTLMGFLWIRKLIDLIEVNSGLFVIDLQTYNDSLQRMFIYMIVGVLIAIGGLVYDKTH